MIHVYIICRSMERNTLEFILLLFFVVVSVLGEGVKQMIDDLGTENAHTKTVGQLLRISFYFYIKRQDHSIPTGKKRISLEW